MPTITTTTPTHPSSHTARSLPSAAQLLIRETRIMESSSIQTAATYVNNLLLARGLLRHGKPVEFAELATYMPTNNHDQKTRATPASAVVADIINLVHDLILKRDVRSATLSPTLNTYSGS